LIVPAAIQMFDQFNIDPQEIDAVVVATITPDFLFPSTTAVVIDKLGLKHAWDTIYQQPAQDISSH
jgi:3-oxoacyl-[acyl-carrier-protein] synthase-3